MKKIPTLFRREFEGHTVVRVRPECMPGCEWVLNGEGEATEKVDGAACAIIGGRFYKRYDVKEGRKPPTEGIPCEEQRDPVTGHWPWWVPVNENGGADRWFVTAYANTPWLREDGTYEAVGPHFQRNPYRLDEDYLEKHGRIKLSECPRYYSGIKEFLRTHEIEGIVFWKDGEPRCKIKRSDFGFEWPVAHRGEE